MVITPLERIYTDQTSKFLYISSRGYQYIMILYAWDYNAILSTSFKSKSSADQLGGITFLYECLHKKGQMTSLHIMDNEAPRSVTNYLDTHNIKHQLVSPHVHRCNAAERAISIWKDYFIARLCTTDPQFPMYLWDRILPQCDYTLNMMRASRLHPTLST